MEKQNLTPEEKKLIRKSVKAEKQSNKEILSERDKAMKIMLEKVAENSSSLRVKEHAEKLLKEKKKTTEQPSKKMEADKNTTESLFKQIKQLKKVQQKKKQGKLESKKEGHNFCVNALVQNLTYCCYYRCRKNAQNMANTLPPPAVFNRRLLNAYRAEKHDKSKKLAAVVEKMSKALGSA